MEILEQYLDSHTKATAVSLELIRQMPAEHLWRRLPRSMSMGAQLIDLGDTRRRVSAAMHDSSCRELLARRPRVRRAGTPEIAEYVAESSFIFENAVRSVKDPSTVQVFFGDRECDYLGAIEAIVQHDHFHWGQIGAYAIVRGVALPILEQTYGIKVPCRETGLRESQTARSESPTLSLVS